MWQSRIVAHTLVCYCSSLPAPRSFSEVGSRTFPVAQTSACYNTINRGLQKKWSPSFSLFLVIASVLARQSRICVIPDSRLNDTFGQVIRNLVYKKSPSAIFCYNLPMRTKAKLSKHSSKPKVYAFIDSQNLNLGASKDIVRHGKKIYKGWNLDFRKFRVFLVDKFRVQKTFLFIGYIAENKKLYKFLENCGYELVFKPTTKDREGKPKGNIDAELVLHCAAIEFKNYDKAVVVSGDGDFLCLYKFLIKNKKLFKIIIPNSKSASSLLKNLYEYKLYLEFEKNKLKKE